MLTTISESIRRRRRRIVSEAPDGGIQDPYLTTLDLSTSEHLKQGNFGAN